MGTATATKPKTKTKETLARQQRATRTGTSATNGEANGVRMETQSAETQTPPTPIPKMSKVARETNERLASNNKVLSDPTRLAVFRVIAERGKQGAYVGEMCSALNVTQPSLSHHLAQMKAAKMIRPDRRGKENWYRLDTAGEKLWRTIRGEFERDQLND
ncbi:MAG: hypothetical protein NVSMB14_10220 [Isosphaeraceae bacterium]